MSLDINLTNVESTTNKKTTLTDNSDTFYPTQKAVKTAVDAKQNTLGFTPENVANLSTDVNTDQASNTKYPSVKAVFDWAVGLFVQKNSAITGATKTKITYDAKGLVTAGADATTADIADSSNKRYVTDAQLTVIGNTSGTNTGDQTLSGLGGVPTTRNITINGTTQDLSADRTFSAVMLTGLPGVANTGLNGATRYFTFSGVAVATAENTRRIIFCNNLTVKNFYIYTSTAQPATGSHVFTVLKNGVATSITVTIASGSAAGLFSDTTNSESFAQGDAISIQAVNNASTNSCTIVSFQIGGL